MRATAGKECWHFICEYRLTVKDRNIRIDIDNIQVKLPSYPGTDPSMLNHACGHIQGSSFPIAGKGTHAAISAHRGLPSAKLFSDLDKLEVGDTFRITVLD